MGRIRLGGSHRALRRRCAAGPSHWQSSSLGRRGSGRGHGPRDGSLGPRPCLSPARYIPYMGQRHLHRNRQRHVVRAVGPGSRPARHGEHRAGHTGRVYHHHRQRARASLPARSPGHHCHGLAASHLLPHAVAHLSRCRTNRQCRPCCPRASRSRRHRAASRRLGHLCPHGSASVHRLRGPGLFRRGAARHRRTVLRLRHRLAYAHRLLLRHRATCLLHRVHGSAPL